jgi:hypothetical protein
MTQYSMGGGDLSSNMWRVPATLYRRELATGYNPLTGRGFLASAARAIADCPDETREKRPVQTFIRSLQTGGWIFLPVLLLAVMSLAVLAACGSQTAANATTTRQEAVATRGAVIMPFDLERTTHVFEKRENGGRQQVIADDASDGEQIDLIRAHLAEEAARFQQGDFHDPRMIHGDGMPGLHELAMGAARIDVVYSELPDGAQILYTTEDDSLVAAIHAWFDAQLADHGAHATGSDDH